MDLVAEKINLEHDPPWPAGETSGSGYPFWPPVHSLPGDTGAYDPQTSFHLCTTPRSTSPHLTSPHHTPPHYAIPHHAITWPSSLHHATNFTSANITAQHYLTLRVS